MLGIHIQHERMALHLVHRCSLSLLLTCFTNSWLLGHPCSSWPLPCACCSGVPHSESTVPAENKCASIITEDTICAMQLSGSGRCNSTLALFLVGMCWLQLTALTLWRQMKNRFVRVRHRLYTWLCFLSIPSIAICCILKRVSYVLKFSICQLVPNMYKWCVVKEP